MLKYQIALTNAIFDDTYRNVLRFDTRAEQEAYFNVNTLFANAPYCNFNVGSLNASRVVIDYGDRENVDLNELMNNNYCIVKDTTPGATLKYYYYFVKIAQQENGNRLSCDLELDVYQTYYIDLTFGDCTIARAHLNRFIDNGDNTVSFDATPSSKLFEREEIQDLPKRLIGRHRIKCGNNFVDDKIICWMYIYLDPNHEFTFYTPNGSTENIKPSRMLNNGLQTNIGCLVVPITRNAINVTLQMNGGNYTTQIGHIGSGGQQFLRGFETLNQGYSYIYSIKYSIMPPSTKFNELTQNMINSTPNITGNLCPSCQIHGLGNGRIVAVKDLDEYISGILLTSTYSENGALTNVNIGSYQVDRQITFNKQEIINANARAKYNPKLNNNDYYELNICDNAGNYFTYDLQKFNKTNLELLMTEPQTPDFTKNYTRLLPPLSNTQYIQETTQNLLGLVTSNDNTVLMPTSAYQTMIANNKNYFAQNSYNRAMGFIKSGIGIATAGNNAEAAIKTAGAVMDYAQSVQNQKYEIDNLRNAPSSIQAANGNFIFNALCSDPGMYIEEYDITENSKKAVNDYTMLYGFNYNRIDNIKNVDNIRKHYNYVKAYVEEINTGLVNISNIVHNRIREIFARGIRMWNARTFDYTKENYERWLEE